jgi:hypothetical protein
MAQKDEPVEEWPWTGFLRASRLRTFDGFELYVYPHHSRKTEDELFARLEQALTLVLQVQPWNKRRMARHIPKLLTVYPSGAEYVQSLRCCVIGYENLLRGSREEVAALIVHEATHGRIDNAGVEYTPECRERIERACVRAETNLLRTLHGQPRLRRRDDIEPLTPWWTERDRVLYLASQLRHLHVPEWVIRAAMLIRSIKNRWTRLHRGERLP